MSGVLMYHAGDGSRICAHLRKAHGLVAHALACLATDAGD
jgi:hypothetical protein